MNKNVTYPKTLECPACHAVADDDVEYWLQDYEFPSWISSHCENPKCDNFCKDFETQFEIVIKVKSDWILVTDCLPEDGQECWTFRPASPKTNPKLLIWDDRVGTHQFWLGKQENSAWWEGSGAGDYTHLLKWNQITHWQPLVRPEAPGETR